MTGNYLHIGFCPISGLNTNIAYLFFTVNMKTRSLAHYKARASLVRGLLSRTTWSCSYQSSFCLILCCGVEILYAIENSRAAAFTFA